MKTAFVFVLACVFLTLCGLPSIAAQYICTQYATIPGMVGSYAEAINDKGDIVGTAHDSAGTEYGFYREYATGKVYNLGMVYAHDVNNSGEVVGELYIKSLPITWTVAGGMHSIGGLGIARSVNDKGQIVGIRNNHATIWNSDGTFTDIGSSFSADSCAFGINESGEVCGIGTISTKYHGFYWTSASGIKDLGVLNGGMNSYAKDINDLGVVVGTSEMNGPNSYATRWQRDGSITILDSSHKPSNYYMSINNKGQVVGSNYVWDANGYCTVFSTSTRIFDINDNGWLTGEINGMAAIWVPVPEPSSIAVLGGSLLGLMAVARRRKSTPSDLR